MTNSPADSDKRTASDTLDAVLRLAKTLAVQAGQLARARLTSARTRVKEDRSVVTDADHAAQQLILDELAVRFPEHAVLAEEHIPDPERHAPLASARVAWVIDPIDGTRNFVRRFPAFSVSIAVFVDHRPSVGVIYDPMTDMLYFAAAGAGAFLEQRDAQPRRLSVRTADKPGGSFVAIASSKRAPSPENIRRWLDWIVLRNVGSTALHLAYVAAGCLDGAFAHDCRLWDIAAGLVLIPEAGGIITQPDGSPFPRVPLTRYARRATPVLAGSPGTHARLLETLQ